jgi:hypothetical protein
MDQPGFTSRQLGLSPHKSFEPKKAVNVPSEFSVALELLRLLLSVFI